MRRVLTEGGPRLLEQIVAAGLLDDLCLTVSPVLADGRAGRIVAAPPAGETRAQPARPARPAGTRPAGTGRPAPGPRARGPRAPALQVPADGTELTGERAASRPPS